MMTAIASRVGSFIDFAPSEMRSCVTLKISCSTLSMNSGEPAFVLVTIFDRPPCHADQFAQEIEFAKALIKYPACAVVGMRPLICVRYA